jgi:phosphoribosylaminoimidazole (AIR) synthetase
VEESTKSQYAALGVDAVKEIVEASFKGIIDNEFPHAFCNIYRDPNNSEIACTLKMDGDGSKMVIRCLHYLQTGDATVFGGAMYDAMAMVAGDAGASNLLGAFELADTIDVNSLNIPKSVLLAELSKALAEIIALHRAWGINFIMSGGETADLPIQVNSAVTNFALRASGPYHEVIAGNVQPGDAIFGFASGGRAVFENEDASDIMSNGYTLANNVLLHGSNFRDYPFLQHPAKKNRGQFLMNDDMFMANRMMPGVYGGKTIGQILTAKTRQWAIVQKVLVEELKKQQALHLLHGMTLNSGGGPTKCLRLGQNIRYVKSMPSPPRIFKLIQGESRAEWSEMFLDFNCGVGMDIVGSPKDGILEDSVKTVSEKLHIAFFNLGKCSSSQKSENEVLLETEYGDFFKAKSDEVLFVLTR